MHIRSVSSLVCVLASCLFLAGSAGAWPDARPSFPLTIDAERQGLVDQDGIPFLVVGDAPWSLMVQLDDDEVIAYLADRRARGFNTLLVESVESGSWGGTDNTNGDDPFDPVDDFSQPVEAYWARVDWILDRTEEYGFLVLLTPMYVGARCGSEGWASRMVNNSAAVHEGYAEFLAGRYASRTNILWVHAGDVDPADCGLDDEVFALAAKLKSLHPGSLHTAHCDVTQNSFDCADQPWLDVDSVYSNCQGTALEVRDAYQLPVSTPHYFVEGFYENEFATETCLLSQMLWPMLGGLQGSVYGNNPVWWFGPGWESALSHNGATFAENSARLIKSRPWAALVPDYDHLHVTSGYGSIFGEDYVGVAVTQDTRTLIAYTPDDTTLTVDLDTLNADWVHAWRYDPWTGAATSLGDLEATGTWDVALSGPMVLVIDDVDSGLPAPGTGIYYVPEPGVTASGLTALTALGALRRSARRRVQDRAGSL